jgi:hypothetical protein
MLPAHYGRRSIKAEAEFVSREEESMEPSKDALSSNRILHGPSRDHAPAEVHCGNHALRTPSASHGGSAALGVPVASRPPSACHRASAASPRACRRPFHLRLLSAPSVSPLCAEARPPLACSGVLRRLPQLLRLSRDFRHSAALCVRALPTVHHISPIVHCIIAALRAPSASRPPPAASPPPSACHRVSAAPAAHPLACRRPPHLRRPSRNFGGSTATCCISTALRVSPRLRPISTPSPPPFARLPCLRLVPRLGRPQRVRAFCAVRLNSAAFRAPSVSLRPPAACFCSFSRSFQLPLFQLCCKTRF